MSSLGYVRESGIFSGPEFVAREFVADGPGREGNSGRDDHEDGPSKKSTGSDRKI